MTATATSVDVSLVTMPFAPAYQPSLALSLLQASLEPGQARVHYETLQFASLIGIDLYTGITGDLMPTSHLVGEWIFAEAAFGPDRERDEAYKAEFLTGRVGGMGDVDFDTPSGARLLADLLETRAQVATYLDGALERVLADEPQVVGFTSVFHQQVASLALARRIKSERPETTIVMGGANCEGVMGLAVLRNFPEVDVVVRGEGELVFREVVDRVVRGESPAGVAGALHQRDVSPLAVRSDAGAPAIEMDAIPIPSYDDYFHLWSALELPTTRKPYVPIETARGCWWGALRHCTFCGLNGESMRFRSKSPDRALAELCHLTERYADLPVFVVDNILDRDYFTTLLPKVAESACEARIFCEVKANLTKEQIRILRDAGVRNIQPGIESLHDAVLRIMRKGVTAIENVQLLKWCAELGVRPHWNLLWGFPGEPQSAFAEMAALIPHLAHLQPPTGAGRIELDRFSPNFDQASELGFRGVRPAPAYQAVYGLGADAIDDLAYIFAFDDSELRRARPLVDAIESVIAQWRRLHADSGLWSVDDGQSLVVWDMRLGAAPQRTHLVGVERELYISCDRACSPAELAARLNRTRTAPISVAAVAEVLAPLVRSGLVMHDGRRYLALAVPLGDEPMPSKFLVRVAMDVARQIDRAGRAAAAS